MEFLQYLLQKHWGFPWRKQLPTDTTHHGRAYARPLPSLPGHLGTQHPCIWQVQDKLLHGELPRVSVEAPHRRGHTLDLTKRAEENRLHTNAYKIKPPQFQCFLPYVVMSRGFINKSCVSRGLNLNRAFFHFCTSLLPGWVLSICQCRHYVLLCLSPVSQGRAWAGKWLEPE